MRSYAETVGAFAFLTLPDAPFITGQILIVDDIMSIIDYPSRLMLAKRGNKLFSQG